MKDKLINLVWTIGIRTFRLARKANLSTRLEPVFARLAAFVPSPSVTIAASLPDGGTLWMPAGYRDARTVVTGLFQEDETRLFRQLTRPGMTFVDLGAYVGYFTILASTLVGSAGRVYAFEPDTIAYQYLVRNIEVNACVNAIATKKAVSDGAKTAALVRDPTGPESFLADSPAEGNSLMVETITLDSFIESQGWPNVDLIKMNIEGSELLALRGLHEVTKRNPGLQLVIEFNPRAMLRAGVSREDLTNALTQLGFEHGYVVERRLEAIPNRELLPRSDAVYNILLTR